MKVLKWKYAEPPRFNSVPEKAGIYIISTRQELDHAYEVKYIGETENLRTRVNEHWSKSEPNKELREHITEHYLMKFNYAEVESKSEREGMVLYMYNIYDPPFNKSAPQVEEPVKCTQPSVRKFIP